MKRKNWFRLAFIALMPLILMQTAWAFIGFEFLYAPVKTKISLLYVLASGTGNYTFVAWSCIVCLACLGVIGWAMLLYLRNASEYENLEKAADAYHEACREMEEAKDIYNKKLIEFNKTEKNG